MNFFIFADGYLQENDDDFRYTIANELFSSPLSLERLKQSKSQYGLPLLAIDEDHENKEFVYKKEEDTYTLLEDYKQSTKSKIWKQKRDWIAYSIIQSVQQEAANNFFVLPIPENFLVSSHSVKFIYKADDNMPITGFDPSQLFVHLKRLVIFIYGKETFAELLEQKETKTSDTFLISIAESCSYEDLLRLIPFSEEKETIESKSLAVNINKERKTIKPQITQEKATISEPVIATKTTENVGHTPASIPKPTNISTIDNSKKKWVFLSVLVLSLLLNCFLAFDKITYPSQVNLLKNENQELIKKAETKEESLNDAEKNIEKLEKSEKELKKDNEELAQELKENVQTIKDLVDKNDELKKTIKK